MRLRSALLTAALLGLAAMALAGGPATAQEEADPEDMVNALNGLYGSHKGYRAVHEGLLRSGQPEGDPRSGAIHEGFAV